jgi:hypothetical protein
LRRCSSSWAIPSARRAVDELLLPPAVDQNQSIVIVDGLEHPATGQGFLDVEWSDVDGRVIERRRIPLDLTKASQVAFSLDTGRALTLEKSADRPFLARENRAWRCQVPA